MFLACLVFFATATYAEKKIVSIKNVKGEYPLPPKSDISSKAAFEKAANEAKLEALRRAGVAENISSSDILTTNQKGANFKQDLSSILSVELNGAVLNDTILDETTANGQLGSIVYRVTMNVDVIVYDTKSDPSFKFTVEGIKEYYENNDLMRFSFLPYANGYLKIFNINDSENFLVYPFFEKERSVLNDSLNKQFMANVKLQFPVNKLMGNPSTREEGYMLSTEVAREHNYLIFVYSKENIPFIGTPTYKNVISWIYNITPEKRSVQFFDFVIVRKDK